MRISLSVFFCYVSGCGNITRAFTRQAQFCSSTGEGSNVDYKLFSGDLNTDWETARERCDNLTMDLLILTDDKVQDLATTLDYYG